VVVTSTAAITHKDFLIGDEKGEREKMKIFMFLPIQ